MAEVDEAVGVGVAAGEAATWFSCCLQLVEDEIDLKARSFTPSAYCSKMTPSSDRLLPISQCRADSNESTSLLPRDDLADMATSESGGSLNATAYTKDRHGHDGILYRSASCSSMEWMARYRVVVVVVVVVVV